MRKPAFLQRLVEWLELPMVVLGLVWLALLIVELVRGSLTPFFLWLSTAIWIVFIAHFLLEFYLAADKVSFLKHNWLTLIAVIVPALRVFRFARILRIARAGRGLRLVRILTAFNRGMAALAQTLGRGGFPYVVGLTVLVALAGAAGMYAFEKEAANGAAMESFGSALWWTAMILTTMGTDYWPRTPEGRILCFFLALYAFAVFGYVTAILATFFVGRERAERGTP